MDQDPATFLARLGFWAGVDKCSAVAAEHDLPDTAHDGTTVHVASYTGCAAGTEVTGYLINGGGHAWPGGERLGDVDEFGITSKQVHASELIATFLGIHR